MEYSALSIPKIVPGYQYDDRAEQKHVVEGGYLVFCRQRHGDKVRSSAAGPCC